MKLTLPAWLTVTALVIGSSCINPFAPRLDTSPAQSSCDPSTVPGVFKCFQRAYSSRDTTLYGSLLDARFTFVYRDYERGIDVTWGRDEELRTTYGLFQNVQRLDLIWNNIVSQSTDSTSINVVRGFNLTIVFNPSDIERVDGYANMTFDRASANDPLRIVKWRDESNY